MKQFRLTLLSLLLTVAACSGGVDHGDGPVATPADFAPLANTELSGTLGYLDYTSERWERIPVSMRFDDVQGRKIRFHVRYPGETQYNETDTLKLSKDGRALSGDVIIERRATGNETVVVTQSRGEDDGRAADIRTTYAISDGTLTITKNVRFDGESDYFRRNAYELRRD